MCLFFRHTSPLTLLDHKESIVVSLATLLQKGAASQTSLERDEDVEGGEEDVGDAEGDRRESIGEVIASMISSLRGYFAADFQHLCDLMMDELLPHKTSIRNKGTILGTIPAVLLYLNCVHCKGLNVPTSGSTSYEITDATADETAAELLPFSTETVQSESNLFGKMQYFQ